MTLIEVIGGLAILATLLVALLVARDRFMRQWVHANQRMEATIAADALLAQWWDRPEEFPRQAAGDVPGRPNLVWRTSIAPNPRVRQLGGQVIRLEVFHRRDTAAVPVTVDIVLPPRLAQPTVTYNPGQ
jgi:hypothetical protein